ncbi:MAG TPA: hypothetical protein VKP67_26385 [Xanthobacteraceae bacterium]|nr:hypothetical protein [Xanthobacteraceae bacterium]
MRGQVDHILDAIADMLRQEKELLVERVSWTRHGRAGFNALEFAAPIATGGVIRDGLQARISCRSDMAQRDVHAQLQVYVPALNAYAHVQRVEWRPNRRHTNSGNAPAKLKFKEFTD